jgi:quercetin dioxygenase-like cupin family protein
MGNRGAALLVCSAALAAAVGCPSASSVAADAGTPATRTVLLRSDLDVPGREVLVVAVEIPPGTAEGMHTHPGELFSLVQQGELTFEMQGAATQVYHAGEVVHVPAGRPHQGINHGSSAVRIAAFFVAPKGQPLTVPVR